MAYPQRLLADGERIEFETRPHWRGLLAPGIILILTVFLGSSLYFWFDSTALGGTVMRWIVLVAGLVILVLWAIVPFLRWLTTQYVFTDRRIIVRRGIITRQGRDIPLSKVNNVSFEVSALGRVLNYGRLVIQSATENADLPIQDVPDVEEIQRDIYKLIEADEQRRMGGGRQLPPNSNA